jgi:CBS domain-containing protein
MMSDELLPYIISSSATLLDAVEKIIHNKSRCVCVMQSDKVIGVFTEGDVMRALLRGTSQYAALSQIIKPSFMYLTESDIKLATEIIREHLITFLPVVDKNFKLLDVITVEHVLDYLAKSVK